MTNIISFPKMIEYQGQRLDLNRIQRVKPVYGTHTRVYYKNDTYTEFADPYGRMFETLLESGVPY